MTSDVHDSESGCDSLPDLSELFPAPSNEISKGDIVWAKFKMLYWPALVRHVYKKEKKVTVWYTDDPGKNFKLPLKNVYLFHDLEMTSKIKKDAQEAGVTQAHEGLTAHAVSYLNRKADGIKDDPLKFFDQTFPFFSVENWLKKNPNADKESFMNLKIEPLYINHGNISAIRKRGRASGPDVSAKDSDIESTDGEEESEDENVTLDNKTTSLKSYLDSSDASNHAYADKIVTYIRSGKVDTHLVNIRSKKISSETQEFYLKAMKSDKRSLDAVSYGPVEDIKKLRDIIFYLLELYDHICSKKDKTRGAKCEVAHFCTTKTEEARYVASVWLPESIIFAISKINGICLSEAKMLFDKWSVFKSEKVETLLENVDRNTKVSKEPVSLSSEGKDLYSDIGAEEKSAKRFCKDICYKEYEEFSSSDISKRLTKKPYKRGRKRSLK